MVDLSELVTCLLERALRSLIKWELLWEHVFQIKIFLWPHRQGGEFMVIASFILM